MKELQRWLDMAPTLRKCALEFFDGNWVVTVSQTPAEPSWGDEMMGHGKGRSLNFAVVAAILDLRKKNQED